MPLKYVTSVNAKEGLGIRVLQTMSAILYARLRGMTYAHTPFAGIGHGVSNGEAERFFGLGTGEVQVSQVAEQVKRIAWINTNPKYWSPMLPFFKDKYRLFKKACRYDPARVSVAIHVRRGDVTPRKSRGRYTPNEAVRYVQQQIASLGLPFDFHLFSQGKPEDFREFEGVTLHLDEDVLDTFHHLVEADILVMARSAFSCVAGFLSDGARLCEPFFYPALDDWLVMREYTLDERQLEKLAEVKPKAR
jgi:hypothetical protein